VRLEWIAASEGDKVQKVINEMTETVRRLGPLHLERRSQISSMDTVPEPIESPAMMEGERP